MKGMGNLIVSLYLPNQIKRKAVFVAKIRSKNDKMRVSRETRSFLFYSSKTVLSETWANFAVFTCSGGMEN